MLRSLLATALVATALALGAPGAALADEQDRFEAICKAAGLEVVDGKCVYPDGSELSCSFSGDAYVCYRSEPKPTLGLLADAPKIIVTTPVRPGPVETGKGELKLKIGAATTKLSDTIETPSERSIKRFDASVTKTDVFDAPAMRTEAPVMAPVAKLKSFN
jgi:hypothetical protein